MARTLKQRNSQFRRTKVFRLRKVEKIPSQAQVNRGAKDKVIWLQTKSSFSIYPKK